MPARNYNELLSSQWDKGKFVCVGLDSDVAKIPIMHLGLRQSRTMLLTAQDTYRFVQEGRVSGVHLLAKHRELLARAMVVFNRRIIDATKDIVCAYKPNSAFYEPLGDWGMKALASTFKYIHDVAPEVPVILDAKRADIGATNIGYAMYAFDYLGADAITVHPYFGHEAMTPFLNRADKGVIVLCRTSNPGAGEFQDLDVSLDGDPDKLYNYDSDFTQTLYQMVARSVCHGRLWNYNGNCSVVVGATYPAELAQVREIIGDEMPILIPGIGKQGGKLEDVVPAGINSRGQGIILNNGRDVLFASDGPDCGEAARAVTLKMSDDTILAISA